MVAYQIRRQLRGMKFGKVKAQNLEVTDKKKLVLVYT